MSACVCECVCVCECMCESVSVCFFKISSFYNRNALRTGKKLPLFSVVGNFIVKSIKCWTNKNLNNSSSLHIVG